MAKVNRDKVPFSTGELVGQLAKEAGRAVVRSVANSSGAAASAGRKLSNRGRQIDAATSWGDSTKKDVRRK